MKFTKLKEKLQKMTEDDDVIDYLDHLQETGKYETIELDGEYGRMFSFDPDDGSISWNCPEHGYCEADFMDLFTDGARMLRRFEETGCGLEEEN